MITHYLSSKIKCQRAFSLCFGLLSLIIVISTTESEAAVTLTYNASNTNPDPAFEHYQFNNNTEFGFLAKAPYNLPRIRIADKDGAPNYQASVLPQVERAVAQITSNNSASGLFIPSSASGIPGQANPNPFSSGVFQPFTSSGITTTSITSGSLPPPANFSGNFSYNFEYKRVGSIVSYSLFDVSGNGTRTWTSPSESYFDEINAIELRVRSTGNNSLSISNLIFNDANTANQSLAAVTASSGNVTLALYEGITGNFSLRGTYVFSQTGTGGWNHQIKGLSLIPEPSTLGFLGLSLAGLLFRRTRQRRE